MNNPYDPTSSIRDQKRYIGDQERAQQAENKDSVIYRKEKMRQTREATEKDFEKVMTRKDRLKKEAKTSKATADEAKDTKSPFAFMEQPEESSYQPSSHEQMMRQQIASHEQAPGDTSEEEVTVNAQQAGQFHSPTGEQSMQGSVAGVEATAARPVMTEEMQELLKAIIDKMYVVQQKGQSDTVITLKHPPLFAGTVLKVATFETARGEFNLAFTGLTQEGKNVLDANQIALQHAMEAKGFVVHIVTTSTVEDGTYGAETEEAKGDERESAQKDDADSGDTPEQHG